MSKELIEEGEERKRQFREDVRAALPHFQKEALKMMEEDKDGDLDIDDIKDPVKWAIQCAEEIERQLKEKGRL